MVNTYIGGMMIMFLNALNSIDVQKIIQALKKNVRPIVKHGIC